MSNIINTQAILLHQIKYGESSNIVTLYSACNGKQSFFCKRNTKQNQHILLPFTLSEIEYYHAQKKEILYLKKMSYAYPTMNIVLDVRKRNIALFLAELLHRTIQEKECNPSLFTFIQSSILLLENLQYGIANFHLYFMVELIKKLGISPQSERMQEELFHIDKGVFTNKEEKIAVMNLTQSDLFHFILSHPIEDVLALSLSRQIRSTFIQALLQFITYHLPVKFNDKSFKIYMEIFSV